LGRRCAATRTALSVKMQSCRARTPHGTELRCRGSMAERHGSASEPAERVAHPPTGMRNKKGRSRTTQPLELYARRGSPLFVGKVGFLPQCSKPHSPDGALIFRNARADSDIGISTLSWIKEAAMRTRRVNQTTRFSSSISTPADAAVSRLSGHVRCRILAYVNSTTHSG